MPFRRDTGSSPLARGLHVEGPRREIVAGIIPARAGFTLRRSVRSRRVQDHPRSRGVYMEQQTSLSHLAGSSPLARGLRTPPVASTPAPRIIPARAGFTG